jgi:methionyl-tRNA formyltransferase
MPRKRVIFLGSKPIGYACFAHLLSVQEALGIDICGILTNVRKEFGDAHDLNTLAAEHNIPVLADVADIPECDILYSVQYHKILKQGDIDKARQLAVNLHMAPLPEYRGSNQFSFAIIDQKKEFGTTLHVMDSRIDHGDILFQKRFAIPDNCWVNDLYELTFEASLSLFKETLEDIVNGLVIRTPQSELEAQYGTSLHYRSEINELKCIDKNWDKEKINRYIRATNMPGFEPPYYMEDGKKMYFSGEQV